jgi:hypothetical protein
MQASTLSTAAISTLMITMESVLGTDSSIEREEIESTISFVVTVA